jgi:rfaE bifunctional protein nucleotidyltransferase chain/domain
MNEKRERILRQDELEDFREEHAAKRIVFTNGCFDLLHRGHIKLFVEAKEFGDCLVVGINSDSSIANLKGPSRPLMNEDDRAFILLQLRPIDYVTIFEEDTPLETIERLRPDVLVKGSEYSRENIVGADFVEQSGGRVERVEMLDGCSTSNLIKRIRDEL